MGVKRADEGKQVPTPQTLFPYPLYDRWTVTITHDGMQQISLNHKAIPKFVLFSFVQEQVTATCTHQERFYIYITRD